MTFLVPDAPVSPEDVLLAARTVLKRVQSHHYMAWRENRWYDDEEVRRQAKKARWDFQYVNRRSFMNPDDMFTLILAQEILIAGLPDTPSRCISSLDQLGIHHETSPDEDYAEGLRLVNLPWLFDWVRESSCPLREVLNVAVVQGQERLMLMAQAGLSADEVLEDTYAGRVLDEDALRLLASLRAPSSVGG